MNIPGLGFLSEVDVGGALGKIGSFLLLLLLFVIVIVIFVVAHYVRKNKQIYNKRIFWFEEVNGEMIPTEDDRACEMTIPNTTVRVFYIKSKDMYLPRGTIRMGKDSYWYCVKNNREIVNFRMKNINKDDGEAGLQFDHTDMRYASYNLKDLIKRNYRDKATKWWKEYKEVISLVILVFVMTISFIFITWYIGKTMDKLGVLIDHADQIIKAANVMKGSGITTAA